MTRSKKDSDAPPRPLAPGRLRWGSDGVVEEAGVKSTADLEIVPLHVAAVQQEGMKAIRFGLESRARGHNIYVRGLAGTGRLAMVRMLIGEIRPSRKLAQDRCYVHNFRQPDCPRLITLPPGRGFDFKHAVQNLADFIRRDLRPRLESPELRKRRDFLQDNAQTRIVETVKPFEEALEAAGFMLVDFEPDNASQADVFPVWEGEPVAPEKLDLLHMEGTITDEQVKTFKEKTSFFQSQLGEIHQKADRIIDRYRGELKKLMETSVRGALAGLTGTLVREFPFESVRDFLEELVEDLTGNRLQEDDGTNDFTRLYGVNVVLGHEKDETCPIIAESSVSARDLLGAIEYEFGSGGVAFTSHMGIHAGTLLKADGGFLIIDVNDIYGEPEAWKILIRVLRTGKLEISPTGHPTHVGGPSLRPEPIPVDIKVVLIGDNDTHAMLDSSDKHFRHLFKILADFSPVIDRSAKAVIIYAQALARLCEMENLPPIDKGALISLIEQGARIAARDGKVSSRFGLIADIAIEAAHHAVHDGKNSISEEEVRHAVECAKERADQPVRAFREAVARGRIRIQTQGATVGQINGLAVMRSGLLTYGFPARITATIGPGTAGVINIEREATLSGAIHTKGFYILGGLLRYLLRTNHPLAFDASVAFEQSYGGIDGDSASGAEICCLLSALTEAPLRQDIAMTGAIDQFGNILTVGAVNEKVEGFFDICNEQGLTGTQGVIIPAANAGDLMLREDVVEACGEGKFRVFALDTVRHALEVLTGICPGRRDGTGNYPEGTLLRLAVDRARDYWLKASKGPPSGRQ